MRGRVADWNDDRGFGFIEPESGAERVFLHISGFSRGAPRPTIGSKVSFEITTRPDGRVCAVKVAPVGFAGISNTASSRRVTLAIVAFLVFPVLWWLVKFDKAPPALFWIFTCMSSVAFVLYGFDKLAAKRGAQRSSENTLQLCALVGGWPGALLAQQVFRHKSSKRSFQVTFWLMVVLNCAVLGLLSSQFGAALVRQLLEAR